MRIGVIRGDLPGPIFLADVETVSQYNPGLEPAGQTIYISRPTVAEVELALANATSGVGAAAQGSNISGSFPITIGAGTQTLMYKTSASAATFTTVLVPTAAYANMAALVAAVNTVLVGATARAGVATGTFAIESNTKGVDSYLSIDTVAHGSTFNTPSGLGAGGSTRTVPTAAAFITACLPVTGPLDVRSATMSAVGAGTSSTALAFIPSTRGIVTALADAMAPRLIDTPTAIKSFQTGQISGYLSASFCPDSRRLPPLASSAAITVVQDDGFSIFTAGLPNVTGAVIGGGNLTIAGTGLGSNERKNVVVKVYGTVNKVLEQAYIEHVGGSVSATQIVVPLSLLPGLVVSTSSVKLKVDTLASNAVAVS
jgi:hypothetical protein